MRKRVENLLKLLGQMNLSNLLQGIIFKEFKYKTDKEVFIPLL